MPGSDRTVSVTLKAVVSGYVSDIKRAESATKSFGQDTLKAASDHKKAWTDVGRGMLVAGAAIAGVIGLAVKSYSDFSKEMSNVQAVSGASAGEMRQLSDAALKAGADTKFSASEAAKATSELAKVGLSTGDILGGALTGALNLAAAGNVDLADAAMYAGQTMKIFKLEGKDVPRIADALASGANKSAADITDLAQALQQGGLQAKQAGLSMEDTVGVLSLFADNALMGSDAGTSLKTMLQRLTPQSKQAADAMADLGLDFYDAKGQFIGVEAMAAQLQTRLGKLSAEQRNSALQTIFGTDAIRAATVLYDAGAKGVQKYVDGVSDQGAAARMAAIQMDNLSGDLEQLRGSIETALIKSGSAANGVLRDMLQAATGLVNGFSNLPQGIQSAGLGLAALAGAGLLAGGAFLTIVPKIAAARTAMIELGVTSTAVKSLLGGPWGLAIGAGVLALGLFAKSQMDAKRQTDELRATLDQQTGAITENTKAKVAQRLQDEGVFDAARRAGVSLKEVTDAALDQNGALDRLRAQQKALQSASDKVAFSALAQSDATGTLTANTGFLVDSTTKANEKTTDQATALKGILSSVLPVNEALGGQADKQREVSEAMGKTSEASDTMSGSLHEAGKSVKELADEAKGAADATLQLASQQLAASNAAIGYQQAVDDASKAVKENGRTATANKKALDLNTEAGRNNQKALNTLADAAVKSATENLKNGASVESVRKSLGTAQAQFVAAAMKMGLSRSAAEAMAAKFGVAKGAADNLNTSIRGIPASKTTKIYAETSTASANIANLVAQIRGMPTSRTIMVQTKMSTIYDAQNRAGGGYISGPGTATSDSIPANLSNGEFVVRAAAVSRYGREFLERVNAMSFASGGSVGKVPASTPKTARPTGGDRSVTVNVEGFTAAEMVRAVSRDIRFQMRQQDALMPIGG